MRRGILEVLGHVVHARISMDALVAGLLVDLQQGIEPLVFGTYWTKRHIDALQVAAHALNVAFHMFKWIQAPVHPSRLEDAAGEIQILSDLAAQMNMIPQNNTKAITATTMLNRTDSQYPPQRDRMRSGNARTVRDTTPPQ